MQAKNAKEEVQKDSWFTTSASGRIEESDWNLRETKIRVPKACIEVVQLAVLPQAKENKEK